MSPVAGLTDCVVGGASSDAKPPYCELENGITRASMAIRSSPLSSATVRLIPIIKGSIWPHFS